MKQKIRDFKKNQILEEAVTLISKLGFHQTTMDKLCENLDVSKPFLYSYFDNKGDLLIEIYDRMVKISSAGIREILSGTGRAEEKIRDIVHYIVQMNIDVQAISAIYMQEEKNLPGEKRAEIRKIERLLDHEFTKLIESGVKDGIFDVRHPRIATLSIFSMARCVHRWYRPDHVPASEVADEIATYALNLIRFQPR